MKLFKDIKYVLQIVAISLFTLMLTGCHILDTMDLCDETVNPPTYPVDNPPPPKTNGTIYQEGHEIALYQDHMASRIGDILTVRLEESTSGQKQADMKTDKNTTLNTNNGSLQNNQSTNNGSLLKPVLFGSDFSSPIFNTGVDMAFNGKGQTDENNKLAGTISVTVTRVLSNNNLVISGEKWITINQGREYIRLTGIVRPEDIEVGNTISSQRVADARIAYSGSGQVGNAARGGWLTQFLYKFFPF